MKSPPSRVFSAPHVHPRPRKRLARCTLDCGFQTSESPALRGFECGPHALATAALYLVLKSNGLPRPKIRLKKFSFSLKTVPATIAKKLPPQCCSKPLLIPFFNFSRKRPTFAFTSESGYTLAFANRIAHKGLHGETRAFRMGVVSLPSERFTRFGNPAWPGFKTVNFAAFGSWPGVLQKNAESLRDSDALMRVAVPRRRGPAGLRDLFSFLSKLRLVCPALRGFPCVRGKGWYHCPRSVSHVSETLRGQVSERRTLPLWDLGRGCSQRTQKAFGTAMRLCASLFRGVAAPLGCVICLQLGDVAVFSLCAQYFLNVRGGGGITTLGALCVLLKRWTAACQKGSFAAF